MEILHFLGLHFPPTGRKLPVPGCCRDLVMATRLHVLRGQGDIGEEGSVRLELEGQGRRGFGFGGMGVEGWEWPQKPPLTFGRGALQPWGGGSPTPPPPRSRGYLHPGAQNSRVAGARWSQACSQTQPFNRTGCSPGAAHGEPWPALAGILWKTEWLAAIYCTFDAGQETVNT